VVRYWWVLDFRLRTAHDWSSRLSDQLFPLISSLINILSLRASQLRRFLANGINSAYKHRADTAGVALSGERWSGLLLTESETQDAPCYNKTEAMMLMLLLLVQCACHVWCYRSTMNRNSSSIVVAVCFLGESSCICKQLRCRTCQPYETSCLLYIHELWKLLKST